MKQLIRLILAVMALGLAFSACGGDTYAKRLDREKKAISRLLSDSGFVEISSYPVGEKFGPKEFYRDPKTGIYIHVVDSGVGAKARKYNAGAGMQGTEVHMQYRNMRYLNDTTLYDNNTTTMALIYGLSDTYTGSSDYYALSPACALPLEHVREGAIVKLIVPFNYGSSYQEATYQPMYVGRLEYVRFK